MKKNSYHIPCHIGLIFLLGLIPVTGWANIGLPVNLKMETPDTVPVPGEIFRGNLVLEVGSDGWVEIESFLGTGWSQLVFDGGPGFDLRQGDRVEIAFSGVPSADYGAIQIEYTFADRPQSLSIDLRRLDPRGNRRPVAKPLKRVANISVEETTGPNAWRPDPAPLPQWRRLITGDPEPQSSDDPATDKSARTITIEGRIAYQQPDGFTYGADGMTVRIYDEDNGPDDHLANGVTDQNGDFSISFTWDPCAFCDGAPDIYVEVESQNSVVEVEEAGLLELNYFWESHRLNDFGGSYYDYGTIGPDDATAPAMFISTQIVRTRRMIQSVAGYTTPYVDVQWPDGSKGAFYRDYWEEMHISTGAQWNADVIAHEYGHHWVNIFGIRQEPEYCNGFCDPNEAEDDCSHCGWCRETVYTTWSEGWPDWLASFYQRHHLAQYGYVPSVRGDHIFEDHNFCWDDSPAQYHAPGLTEGAFAAFLRDIEDAANDNDPRNPLFSDVMTEDPSLIFDAASSQNPDTPTRFITQFRNLNPALDEALWETLMNNGYIYDTTVPQPPTNITSANHVVGVASPGARIG